MQRWGEETTSTSIDADGAYTLLGLPAGTYDLDFSKSGFQDKTVNGVAVTAGETTALDDVVLKPES